MGKSTGLYFGNKSPLEKTENFTVVGNIARRCSYCRYAAFSISLFGDVFVSNLGDIRHLVSKGTAFHFLSTFTITYPPVYKSKELQTIGEH